MFHRAVKILKYPVSSGPGNEKNWTNTHIAGVRRYELSNHLGNVMAVVSDRKLQNNSITSPSFIAEVYSVSDYYPFGSPMRGRNYNAGDYKYGYNGQEKDNEVKGIDGGSLHFTFREYDPRLARFFAVDPLTSAYPALTPYQFASNTPIWARELEGLEAYYSNDGSRISGEQAFNNPGDGYTCIDERDGRQEIYNESNKDWLSYQGLNEVTIFGDDPNKIQMTRPKQGGDWESFMTEWKGDAPHYGKGLGQFGDIAGAYFTGVLSLAAGGVAGGSGSLFSLSAEAAGTKMGLSVLYQGIVNGFSEVDFADVAFDGFTSLGAGSTYGGAIDWTPFSDKNQFGLVGYNKPVQNFMTDFGVGMAGGTLGDGLWNGFKPMLNNATERIICAPMIYNLPVFIQQKANEKFNEPK